MYKIKNNLPNFKTENFSPTTSLFLTYTHTIPTLYLLYTLPKSKKYYKKTL